MLVWLDGSAISILHHRAASGATVSICDLSKKKISFQNKFSGWADVFQIPHQHKYVDVSGYYKAIPRLGDVMERPNNFEIFIRRKIPFVSSLLMGLMFVFFIFAFILLVAMTPSSYSSDEMKLAYYILIIPNSIKIISAMGFLGLIVTIPLYYRARLNKPATIAVNNNAITIKGRNIDTTINTKQIEKIFVNDLHDLRRQLKYKLQIVIQQKSGKQTTFRLKNYTEADDFLSIVSILENVQFSFYDDNMPTDHNDE